MNKENSDVMETQDTIYTLEAPNKIYASDESMYTKDIPFSSPMASTTLSMSSPRSFFSDSTEIHADEREIQIGEEDIGEQERKVRELKKKPILLTPSTELNGHFNQKVEKRTIEEIVQLDIAENVPHVNQGKDLEDTFEDQEGDSLVLTKDNESNTILNAEKEYKRRDSQSIFDKYPNATVLKKIRKWGDYPNYGHLIRGPSKNERKIIEETNHGIHQNTNECNQKDELKCTYLIPMKTPLSIEVLEILHNIKYSEMCRSMEETKNKDSSLDHAEQRTNTFTGNTEKRQKEMKEENEGGICQSELNIVNENSGEALYQDFTERQKRNSKYFTIDMFIKEQIVLYNRKIGLIIDLCNHECLYQTDLEKYRNTEIKRNLKSRESKDERNDPSYLYDLNIDYQHLNFVAKEIPSKEKCQEVGLLIEKFKREHPGEYIGIHCSYGFNRTGFVVCSYLIEFGKFTIDEALDSFARSRVPGVKHEDFKEELRLRYRPNNNSIKTINGNNNNNGEGSVDNEFQWSRDYSSPEEKEDPALNIEENDDEESIKKRKTSKEKRLIEKYERPPNDSIGPEDGKLVKDLLLNYRRDMKSADTTTASDLKKKSNYKEDKVVLPSSSYETGEKEKIDLYIDHGSRSSIKTNYVQTQNSDILAPPSESEKEIKNFQIASIEKPANFTGVACCSVS